MVRLDIQPLPLEQPIQLSHKFLLTPTIKFTIDEESLFAFEFFTIRDPVMVAEINSFLKFSSKKRVLLDIGALFGIFSLAFTKSGVKKRALAIEPSPKPFSVLNNNMALNPKLDISAHKLALGSKNQNLDMYYQWLHLVVVAQSIKKPPHLKVRVETIDSFIKKIKVVPDLVKIDVEGMEYDVLMGGKKYFTQYKPLVFLETHTKYLESLGITPHDLTDMIRSLGYKAFDLKGNLINNLDGVLKTNPNFRLILNSKPLS